MGMGARRGALGQLPLHAWPARALLCPAHRLVSFRPALGRARGARQRAGWSGNAGSGTCSPCRPPPRPGCRLRARHGPRDRGHRARATRAQPLTAAPLPGGPGSRPAASSPSKMLCAASDTAFKPLEHTLLTWVAGTVGGRPPRAAACWAGACRPWRRARRASRTARADTAGKAGTYTWPADRRMGLWQAWPPTILLHASQATCITAQDAAGQRL